MAHFRIAVVASIVCVLVPVFACEIRVRDSAFRTARDIHKLYVIADSNDPSSVETEANLRRWLDESGDDLNLDVALIHADDPDTDWNALGLPSAPPGLPVTVLIGRDNGSGTNFIIDYWEPAPSQDQLDRIATSPVRTVLARELASHVAVLIYAPGAASIDSGKQAEVESMIEQGITGERIGLSMIVLDRDDPDERLLSKFMGLRPGAPDTLCVAFGRGKLMSPPLVGDAITTANIDQLVTQIRQACSCSKPLPTMGVDVPLVWSADVDSSVILMDDELDLSTLADEVQTMLAGKASAEPSGTETGDAGMVANLVPIPSGAAAESMASPSPIPAAPAVVAGRTNIVIATCMALFAFVVVMALAGKMFGGRSKR